MEIPKEIWNESKFYNGEFILDMSTPMWKSLTWQKQEEYAHIYQAKYAKDKHLDLNIICKLGEAIIEMVLIPPGRFLMWKTEDEIPYEKKVERISLIGPFYISKTKITQSQWEIIMRNNPSIFNGPDLPVENVSWNDCMSFCEKTGFFLPTEAQWEFACRAGVQMKETLDRQTCLITQQQPNAYGVSNMADLIFEWCLDQAPFKAYRPAISATKRVVKGVGNTSIYLTDYVCKRSLMDINFKYQGLGFRVVKYC